MNATAQKCPVCSAAEQGLRQGQFTCTIAPTCCTRKVAGNMQLASKDVHSILVDLLRVETKREPPPWGITRSFCGNLPRVDFSASVDYIAWKEATGSFESLVRGLSLASTNQSARKHPSETRGPYCIRKYLQDNYYPIPGLLE